MQSKSEKILFGGILVFLACYFSQLFDMHNLLSIAIGAAIGAILLFKQKKFRLDVATGLLVLTAAIYFIKDLDVIRAFTSHSFYEVVIMYVLANYLACEIKAQEKKEEKIVLVLLVMVIGLTVHGLLNSYTFLDGQWKDGNIRVWKDFWSGEYVHGTMQVLYYLPAIALVFPALMFFKNKKICNVFLVLSAIFFVYISIVSQSRMSVVILPVVFFVQAIIYVLLNKEQVRKYITKRIILILTGVLLTGVIIVAILLFSTSSGKTFISILDRDGGIFNNIRFKIQRSALKQLLVYPMGGNLMDHLGYAHAHNVWLDIADIGGIIPFTSFVGYTAITIYELIKLVLKKDILIETKMMVMGLYVVYFLFFTIEPGLNWHVYFIAPWLFLHGLVHGYIKKEKTD